jgi:phosphoglycerate dehydrogenase-like enzyme
MKILILCPKNEFNEILHNKLEQLGNIIYTDSRRAYPLDELIDLAKDAEILAFDPDNIGGFEVTPERIIKLMDAMPNLKGLCLSTTAFGYLDLDYCKKRNIAVTNVPHYSTESVAEHALTFILGLAKRVFTTERDTCLHQPYKLVQGFELKDKTLGVIGLGDIGSRIAQLGAAIGMKAIGWNRTPKKVAGVDLVQLEELLKTADVISINLAFNAETKHFLNQERIALLKPGVIIVNNADRELIDEAALAEALKSGKVDSYAAEVEDLTAPPLGNLTNVFHFKGFGWYTEQALNRNKEIWVDNIIGVSQGKPVNKVN